MQSAPHAAGACCYFLAVLQAARQAARPQLCSKDPALGGCKALIRAVAHGVPPSAGHVWRTTSSWPPTGCEVLFCVWKRPHHGMQGAHHCVGCLGGACEAVHTALVPPLASSNRVTPVARVQACRCVRMARQNSFISTSPAPGVLQTGCYPCCAAAHVCMQVRSPPVRCRVAPTSLAYIPPPSLAGIPGVVTVRACMDYA
jgi:hypothetical protein